MSDNQQKYSKEIRRRENNKNHLEDFIELDYNESSHNRIGLIMSLHFDILFKLFLIMFIHKFFYSFDI